MSFNAYWYIGLAILSLMLLIYIGFKTKSIQSLLLFLVIVQCIYLVETVIYVFLESYQYYPKIIKHNAFYDSNIGAMVSNLLAVPAIATLIATFQLNWSWIFFFIGLFAGIEWLFIKLQIYTVYWWRIEYTSLGLLLCFTLAKAIYRLILYPLQGLGHSIVLFLCIAPISGTFHIAPIMWLLNRYYLPGWFEDPGQDTTAFASIYYICVSSLIVVLVKLNWKHKWLKYVFLVTVVFTVTIILERVGILHSSVWWDQWLYIFFPLVILWIAEAISKQLSIGSKSFFLKR